MLRYIIGFFVTIGLIILLIVLLFTGGNSDSKTVPKTGKQLSSYANTDTQVRLSIDGPIISNQEHQSVRFTVDQNNVVLDTLKGYDGAVTDTKTYANTQASYFAFLSSLQLLNFTEGKVPNADLKSEAGHCAQGQRYVFEIIQNGSDIQRYWATSCGGPHTYLGNVQSTIDLFKQQIPDYESMDLAGSF